MQYLYQFVLVIGVILFFINLKNKIVNKRERGAILYKLLVDNKWMNYFSIFIFSMLALMGVSFFMGIQAGNEIAQDQILQYVATIILYIAVSMNAVGGTVITEGGIIKNNMLIKWDSITRTEWTGFNGKTCKLIIHFGSGKGAKAMRITVSEDRTEKDKVTSLMKQYRKSSKKKK
ncbi:MAG: hypothetical protein JXQ26_07130 [Tissierellales bacterium]|nr:hypothetical protein [Tissierellales bacterium]MBN2827745.1 hypothetical protein [Tissierellales bacterium]